MPLCGLYTLLLDRQLPRAFRVALAAEIRTRASRILPHVQLYQMKEVAFPTNYLMLIYNKNRDSFVNGKEIHSAVPKKR
uniref:Secreted protein n=1 Tax=Panagrellus redivivus TaxID=6233 RepID=A0A7E4VQM5_PANRE